MGEHIETYGPFGIYELNSRYYAVIGGKKSREFDTIEELYNSINAYLGIG